MYADGGGLYLQVKDGKSWIFRYHLGRARYMGLGPLSDVSLTQAREKAARCRDLLREGLDPIEERRQRRAEARLASSRSMTFSKCAEAYIEAHAPSWRNPKHQAQWTATLATYADPVVGKLEVRDVGTDHVLRILEPIWTEKHETARRLRARLERILSWATTRGYREGDNPARWHGHLKDLLAAKAKTAPVRHHPALPYDELPAFMADLRKREAVAALALEFAILTAARTGEVVGATWDEIDTTRKEWTVPGERMKSGKPHRVPLSAPALAVLKKLEGFDDTYVFPGTKRGKPMSNMAMLQLLKRMDRAGITVHGFRSTFRDWAAERTAYPNHVVEMALAHVIPDAVERAYRRGEMLEKRQRLMRDWAKFATSKPAKTRVTPIRKSK